MSLACDPQFLSGPKPQVSCIGTVTEFLAQDPVTAELVPWILCQGHRDRYLRCRRCRNRLVSPYMMRYLCVTCVDILRESGECEHAI